MGATGRRTKAVVIGALGRKRPIANALATLSRFSGEWDCIALAYEKSMIPSFPARCSVLYEPVKWGTLVRRASNKTAQYRHVALVLDDVVAKSDVQPDSLVRTMTQQRAGVISPGILRTHHMNHLTSPCLYEVRFIEVFFVIFESAAWGCFQEIFNIFPENRSLTGWGVDYCFFAHCRVKMLYDNRIKAVHGRRLNPYADDVNEIREFVKRSNNASCFSKHQKGPAKCVS